MRGALSFWNGMLLNSEIMCFEFIESCAMKRGFHKTSCFQFLGLWNGVLWVAEMVCYQFPKSYVMKVGFPKIGCFQFLGL